MNNIKQNILNLKGGIIIIGSLIWEDHLDFDKEGENYIRRDWRNQNLSSIRKQVSVPIRYGKKSSTRKDTYTMIFTKGCESNLGKGLILEFQHTVDTFEYIERQAIALAIAEGIYKKLNKRISTKWASVGLLINPTLKQKDLGKFEYIIKKWSEIYSSFGKDFVAEDYKCDDDQNAPIDKNGMLTLDWQESMNEFDLLLATPVKPEPKTILTPQEIAEKMIEKKYDTYFKSNIANGITTYQDSDILKLLPT